MQARKDNRQLKTSRQSRTKHDMEAETGLNIRMYGGRVEVEEIAFI